MTLSVDPDDAFHVLYGDQVTLLSLEQLDHLYQHDQIGDGTLLWQQGLGEWLRLDVVLAELERQDRELAPAHTVAEDSYYVSLGDGEVKLLSLDQLDQFYRLEVIDLGSLVWQPGFVEWVPLELLLGAAEVAQPVSVAPSQRPESPGARRTGGHYSRGPNPSQPLFAQDLSFAVVPRPAPVSPWYRRSLLAASLVSALLILQRNGALLSAAEGMGQAKNWAPVERTVGGQALSTPHGVALWLRQLRAERGLDELAETEPVAQQAAEQAASSTEQHSLAVDAAPSPSPVQAAAPGHPEAAPPTTDPKAEALAAQMKAKLEGLAPEPLPAQAARARPARRSGKKAVASSTDTYDPMNGSL